MTVLIFISIALLLSTVAMRYIVFSNSTIEVVDQQHLDDLVAEIEQENKSNQAAVTVPDDLIIDPNISSMKELLAVG